MSLSGASPVPLLSDDAQEAFERTKSSKIEMDEDGVLYHDHRAPDEKKCRRRMVIPESTEGRTRHLVVASTKMDSNLPNTMYTDFDLVSKGEVTEGFRYWTEKGILAMSSPDDPGSEMANYIQIVTLNSWSNNLGFTTGNIILTAIGKYATVTFIATINGAATRTACSLALSLTFILNIVYQLAASFLGVRDFWRRHSQDTGDLVLQDCHDSSILEGKSFDPSWKVGKAGQFRLFMSLWMTEFFMVPRTIKEAPIVFHNWKGAGEFASIKAEGARVQMVGHMTKAAFQAGEHGNRVFLKRQVVSILSDIIMAGLKFYLSMQGGQGHFFNTLTIFLPLAVTMYAASRCYTLLVARARFHESLVKQIEDGSEDDPATKTATQLLRLQFAQQPDDVRKNRRPSENNLKNVSVVKKVISGNAVTVRKFASRIQKRLASLSEDLILAERKFNIGHLSESLLPTQGLLEYFAQDQKDTGDVVNSLQKLRRSVIGDQVCICVLGGTEFRCPDSEELVTKLAQTLSQGPLAGNSTFFTGGLPGVQKTFAENFGDGYQLWNLLPKGQSSGYQNGQDVNAGNDMDQRKEVFGKLGDIYITVEGGPGVAQEAQMAAERGASIVPLMRTGGASSGKFDFPASALQKPQHVQEAHWALLSNKEAPIQDSANAAAAIVTLLATKKPLQQVEKHLQSCSAPIATGT